MGKLNAIWENSFFIGDLSVKNRSGHEDTQD
jgi:hypothetical protein